MLIWRSEPEVIEDVELMEINWIQRNEKNRIVLAALECHLQMTQVITKVD